MIYGAKYYNDKACHYSQTNNPTEEVLRKVDLGDGDKDHNWLETCGPTSALNCMAAIGHNVMIKTPGGYLPQPEEVLSDYFNDPRNYATLNEIRRETPGDKWMGNRIPQFYPTAVYSVFGVQAHFGYFTHESVINRLKEGKTYQACLINPGHYISIVAYDSDTNEFIYNDSWLSRPGLKNGGFNERMTVEQFQSNCRPYGIFYI